MRSSRRPLDVQRSDSILGAMSAITQIESGSLEGEIRTNHIAFRGIPFSAPPIGKRRFAPPAPPEPWTQLRAARTFGPAAMQGEPFVPGAGAEGPMSEDCLYLNVYTPGLDGRRRPVLVFIHGGAFIAGSSSSPLYDGGRLAELGDQVVVTFNYRLGAFGYLCLGDEGARWGAVPNLGALDQLAALRWIRTNIDRFGGDAANVTLFGESAGATSLLHLVAMPAAEGLFHRAIAQSPGSTLTLPDRSVAVGLAEQLLAALSLRLSESERLRDLPAQSIVDAQMLVRGRPGDWLGFFPVLDSATLSRQPRDVFNGGGGARVPLMIGTNRDEWNLFDFPSADDAKVDFDPTDDLVAQGFPAEKRDQLPHLLDVYRRSRAQKNLPHSGRALRRAVLGDMRFRLPTIRMAETHAARNLPTYCYFFTYCSPAAKGALGACHALELPFVFGTLDAPMQEHFAGSGDTVRALSDTMMRAWSSFAATGAPETALGEWPRFDVERRMTRIFDVTTRTEMGPHDEERAAWEGIL
jgi:para-nitrobenzyl esterase